jgi:hypothetical protein
MTCSKDAQAAVHDSRAAVNNAEKAVVSPQANVHAAIAALTTNGNGGRDDGWARARDMDLPRSAAESVQRGA